MWQPGIIYAYMYVCMYVCIYIYKCIYVYMYICIYVYMYICIYVYMYICIYVYMYICIYVYMYICTYVHMYICIYVYMYICIYVYMYICMYVYKKYISMCVYIYMLTPPPHDPPEPAFRKQWIMRRGNLRCENIDRDQISPKFLRLEMRKHWQGSNFPKIPKNWATMAPALPTDARILGILGKFDPCQRFRISGFRDFGEI